MSFEKEMIGLQPQLKRFAESLCGNSMKASDLVQETFLKAWSNRESFETGTNLRAWLFTILHNTYVSEKRKYWREVEDREGLSAAKLAAPDNPEDNLRLKDLAWAWHALPFDQQEALMLVGVEGMSYDDVAAILGCAVGTVKSRVNRSRQKLANILGEELPRDAIEQAWDKVQEFILLNEDELPSILGEAVE